MSMQALEGIMADLKLNLSEEEKIELDEEINNKIGVLGLDHCELLETKWETDKNAVEEFITKWLEKKRKKKKKESKGMAIVAKVK